MTRRWLRAQTRQGDVLRAGFQAVRDEQGVPAAFPDEVLAEAVRIAAGAAAAAVPGRRCAPRRHRPPVRHDRPRRIHRPRPGRAHRTPRLAATGCTTRSPTSRRSSRPGSALDVEAHLRGVTFYSPDLRTSLHPPVLSEGVASLLPDVVRPAVLWRIDLDSAGHARRGRRRAGAGAQRREARRTTRCSARSTTGTADESLVLLREVGLLRQELEVERGGIDVRVPDQEIEDDGPGYRLAMRAPHPVESWNAQISLLTGMSAARMMLDAGVGIVRTMPPPAARRLRAAAAYGGGPRDRLAAATSRTPQLVRDLDPRPPSHAAFLNLVTVLLRSAELHRGRPRRRRRRARRAAPRRRGRRRTRT